MPDPKPTTAAPRLKLVIRRLPPTIPEEIFWRSVSEWVDGGKSTWRKWYQGKKADDSIRQHRVFSRAYVVMSDFDKLRDFASAFDGHVFRGKDGTEYQAVVEYAPSQKIPSQKSKPRVDARQGQIDKDPDFLSFLESLAAPMVKPDVTTLAASEPYDKHQSTPLLEFLNEQRMGKRGAAGDSFKEPRTRREREKEKMEKKRAIAAGSGGGEKSGNGNGKQANAGRTTGSAVAPSAVPGQIKIAKRPTTDDPSKDARQQKKGVPVALPDAGKRAEVKIQMKTGPGQAPGPGQGNKGKKEPPIRGGPNPKAPKPDAPSRSADSKARNPTNRPTPQPSTPSQTPSAQPDSAPAKRAARPPGNLQGSRNLLTAALKSSTRDAAPRSEVEAKPSRNRSGKPGPSGPAGQSGPSGAITGAEGGEAVEKERRTRPPRNRGRKAAGDAPKTGDQPGASGARIDA